MNPYDFDPSRLKDLKPACARIVTPTALGTAFSIGMSRVLTCNHVVESAADARCHFGDIGKPIDFRILQRYEKADIAVLEAVDPNSLKDVPATSVVAATPKLTNWWAWGFPAVLNGQGVPLFGFVADEDCTDHEGRKTIQLFAENLAGEDAQLGGLSGSPVLSGTEVVAMIYRVLAGRTDGKQARFGMIFALPITTLNPAFRGVAAAGSPVTPMPPPDPKPSTEEAEQLRLFGKLKSASTTEKLFRVLGEWQGKGKVPLPPNVPLIVAEKMIGMGAPRAALTVLEGVGNAPRADQLRALSHSLLGHHDAAHGLLVSMPPSGESGGISGGVFKRRYLETRKKAWLQGAFDEYERTYEVSRDPYPGINAAATALWLGNKKLSRARAKEVLEALEAKPTSERTHWDWATLGEAFLLGGKTKRAISCYQEAIGKDPTLLRNISVMRKQARISLRQLGRPTDKFEAVLMVGGVACFSGHRVDEPGRLRPRFPRDCVEPVARCIRTALDKCNIHFGFSSAAGGADILFLEQLLERHGEPTVFLPFPKEAFAESSVGPEWRVRYDAVLARISPENLHVLMDKKPQTPEAENEAYAKCNNEIQNAAMDAGRIYDEAPVLIAVLNSAENRSGTSLKGGTAEAVRTWKEQLRGRVIVIDPLTSGAIKGNCRL